MSVEQKSPVRSEELLATFEAATLSSFLMSLDETEQVELEQGVVEWTTAIQKAFSDTSLGVSEARATVRTADARLNAIFHLHQERLGQRQETFYPALIGQILHRFARLHIDQVGAAGPQGLHRILFQNGIVNVGRASVTSLLSTLPNGQVAPVLGYHGHHG